MTNRLRRRGQTFRPEQYPTIDMIPDQ